MKSPKITLLMMLFCGAALASAKDPSPAARDDASQDAYSGGWNESGGGSGFGSWKFQESHGATDSFAGHFLAASTNNPELEPIASGGKAFGLYANGSEFETAAAFRAFSTALKAGDSFTFQMVNDPIEQKGSQDNPGAGAVGLTLRSGNAADAPDDYNKGSRFEIINLKGQGNYQVYDGETSHDTGVAYSDKGVTVKLTLTSVDTYDLEITRLADKKTTTLSGRRFSGSGNIESLCIFDRNGEKADGFFNNFTVSGK